jgi:oligopeptide/dipeptide ABC transporter ATP-binding protein
VSRSPDPDGPALLDVEGLTVEYATEDGALTAVEDVDLRLREGEILGVVGESGCGKTTLTKAILDLLPENGRIADGSVRLNGRELTTLSDREWRSVRWEEVSYVVQNAMNALDPVHRVGSQFVEIIRAHTDRSRAEARELAGDLVESVGIDRGRLRDYPHELSGGQRQRVVIALALALEPPLVVADEPTTGLDVVIQDEILQLIAEKQAELGSAMIIITHDISVVAEIADRVAVMYGGQVAEVGPTREVFKRSAHPYTMGLTNAFPSLSAGVDELVSIPGSPPDLVSPPDGCRFADRCPFATTECAADPPLTEVGDDHAARCHYTDRAERFRAESERAGTWRPERERESVSGSGSAAGTGTGTAAGTGEADDVASRPDGGASDAPPGDGRDREGSS